MPHRQMRAWPAFVFGALAFMSGCGSAAFIPTTMGPAGNSGGHTIQDAGKSSTQTEPDPTTGETQSGGLVPGPGGWVSTQTNSSTGTATTNDGESQASAKPQPVSGAFLTCATLNVPSADPSQANYGCSINTAPNTPANMFGSQVTWAVVSDADGTDIGSAASFAALPPGSPWMVQLTMPAAMTAQKSVRASVIWPYTSQPDVLTAELAAAPKSNTYELANSTVPYHIGDGAFQNTHCYTGVASIPLLGPGLTVSLTVPSGGANLDLALTGLCGVDYDQVSAFQVLDSNGQAVASTMLRRGDHSASLAPVALAAGTYTLQIKSGAYGTDIDDFVIAAIFVQSDQPLQIGTVTAMPSNSATISGPTAVNN